MGFMYDSLKKIKLYMMKSMYINQILPQSCRLQIVDLKVKLSLETFSNKGYFRQGY